MVWDKRDVLFVGRGHAPAANVGLSPHLPSSTAPHLALPLGELAACRRCQWRACYPGGRPPPQGVTRFVTGWRTGKTLSAQCAHWAPPPEGEARRPVAAANVGLSLHRPSSTVPKPSPSGEGGPAKPGRMRGGSVKAITSAKNPTFPPHIRQRSKIFASFSPGGSLFYANFSAYKKSGGLPKFGNPPDFLIDNAPSAWQTGAGCAGFCPG